MLTMEYRLVIGSTPPELNKAVNELLKDGWVLHGSPIYLDKQGPAQAMTFGKPVEPRSAWN